MTTKVQHLLHPVVQAKLRRFTIKDYHRLGELRFFREDERVELLEGEIVEMTPIGEDHALTVDILTQLLTSALGQRALIRVQNPIVIPDDSEPQPDLSLAVPPATRYRRRKPGPADLYLVIEVGDSSTRYDREVKVPFYARAGIREYWLIDLGAGRIEVYRDPGEDGYGFKQTVGRGGAVSPEAFPDVRFTVDAVLGAEDDDGG